MLWNMKGFVFTLMSSYLRETTLTIHYVLAFVLIELFTWIGSISSSQLNHITPYQKGSTYTAYNGQEDIQPTLSTQFT